MLIVRQVGLQAPDSAKIAWLKSLYTAECALPKCWQGLEIGKTTVRQAVELLSKNPDVRVEVRYLNANWFVHAYLQTLSHEIYFVFSGLPDDPVPSNTLWIYFPEQALTLGEVFAAFGTLKQVWTCDTCPVDYYGLSGTQLVTYPSDRLTPYVSIQSVNILPEASSN
ncbi:MAG: hypothetical protein RML95_03210 [Anaerolineae bacterium]|nr:hypothetical protein [Anaerolineae bacterium]MDW8298325.1 hypothetical protein [Anaerolineae bacterium]